MNLKINFNYSLLVLFLAISTFSLYAQNETSPKMLVNPYRVTDHSLFSDTEFPVLFSDSKISGYEKFSGSLSVENNGAKITLAPFILSRNYDSIFSETRIQLSQKNKITTLGLSLKFNPSHPRSPNGKKLWNNMWEKIPRSITENKTYKVLIPELIDKEEFLETEIASLNKNLEAADEYEERKRIEHEIASKKKKKKLVEKNYTNLLEELNREYGEALLNSRAPIITFSYNWSLFPVLSGSDKDSDNDGLNDNEYITNKHSLAASIEWKWSPKWQFSGLVGHFWERPDAEKGSTFARSIGFGLTVGRVIMELNKEEHRNTKEYKKFLFIPRLVFAVSFEGSVCTANKMMCKEGIEKKFAITPFIDFKIKRDTQFRIGLSFTRLERVDEGKENSVGITSSLTLVLSKPK